MSPMTNHTLNRVRVRPKVSEVVEKPSEEAQVPRRPLCSAIFTNPRRVRILHDNFTATRKHLLALCEESVGLRARTLT